MKTSRRKFLKSSFSLFALIAIPVKIKAVSLLENSQFVVNESIEKIRRIISLLKKENSSIVKKVMAGKPYKFDPYFHYPIKGGIVDKKNKSRVFFHCHRENEFGHFHTFVYDENENLVHLVLISMDKNGNPVALSTVNRWVTDDTYVSADELKRLLNKFEIAPKLFHDERVLSFINSIMRGYKSEIHKLFDERDAWIKNYAFEKLREPFEDREFEVLSSIKIEVPTF